MENKDLKYIKKFYGEKMMHLCREFFSTILDEEGKLSQIMQKFFEPTRALYDELIEQNLTSDFRDFIMSCYEQKKQQEFIGNELSPEELFDKAGYILYPECKTEEDIQSFKKYYAPGEQLCTFRGNRLYSCRVWFAVKKNVKEIKREDFINPQREDEYGTSVISIQFSKEGGWLSIKNRYNHAVPNPDSTFSNRLDNIIQGLDYCFREKFELPLVHMNGDLELELNNFVCSNDGKFYHYNLRMGDLYFCEHNVVINAGQATQFDQMRDILIDNILINKHRKTIEILSSYFDYDDSCIQGIDKIAKIDEIKKIDGNKDIVITNNKGQIVTFTVNKYNSLVGYTNENITKLPNDFLRYNKNIKNVSIPNAKIIGDNFLQRTLYLENINFPKVEQIGNECMILCNGIEILDMPYVKEIGDEFLCDNATITEFIAPNLSVIGDNFIHCSQNTKKVILPQVRQIGNRFLFHSKQLEHIDLPNVEKIGDYFFGSNKKITTIDFPKLRSCGSNFMSHVINVKNLNLPNLEYCDDNFLSNDEKLTDVNLPNLKSCGNFFIAFNDSISKIYMPKLESCGTHFLLSNLNLDFIDLPNLKQADDLFIACNERIKSINLPNVKYIGSDFLALTVLAKVVNFPKLLKCGERFFQYNKKVKIYAPKCKTVDPRFVKAIQQDERELI